MTKKDAEKKWCPMQFSNPDCHMKCVADNCMWWFWYIKPSPDKIDSWKGRCGAVKR